MFFDLSKPVHQRVAISQVNEQKIGCTDGVQQRATIEC
jgi:hypothetical protein